MLGAAMATNVPKLYALPASHPCAAVAAALRLKRIEFQRVDLLPLTQLIVGPLRYGGHTVPGMRIDGEQLVGSRAIMRRLDQLVPDPPLLPAPGSPAYARVLEAERWGDEVLQSVPRRVLDLAFVREPSAMLSYAADAKLIGEVGAAYGEVRGLVGELEGQIVADHRIDLRRQAGVIGGSHLTKSFPSFEWSGSETLRQSASGPG